MKHVCIQSESQAKTKVRWYNFFLILLLHFFEKVFIPFQFIAEILYSRVLIWNYYYRLIPQNLRMPFILTISTSKSFLFKIYTRKIHTIFKTVLFPIIKYSLNEVLLKWHVMKIIVCLLNVWFVITNWIYRSQAFGYVIYDLPNFYLLYPSAWCMSKWKEKTPNTIPNISILSTQKKVISNCNDWF